MRINNKLDGLLTIIGAMAVLAGGVGASHAQNLIVNGDFTANASEFTTWPGYTGGANAASITNSGQALGAGYGVNGAAVAFAGSPFGPTDAGGLAYAFMQGSGELSALGHKFGDVFEGSGSQGEAGCALSVATNSWSWTRVNFHSNGRAMCS